MARHRVRPNRRRGEPAYRLDVWRSVAALLTDEPHLDPEMRRVLAAHLMIEFRDHGTGIGVEFPARTPEEFITCVTELYEAKMLGIEDGEAFIAVPDRDALGRTYARRVPKAEMGAFVEALRQSVAEDGL